MSSTCKRDGMFQLGLEVQVMDLAADRPLEAIGDVAAGERLLDAGLGPGPGRTGRRTRR